MLPEDLVNIIAEFDPISLYPLYKLPVRLCTYKVLILFIENNIVNYVETVLLHKKFEQEEYYEHGCLKAIATIVPC
jgi:hypothetical protein